jgi:hypothetical protein
LREAPRWQSKLDGIQYWILDFALISVRPLVKCPKRADAGFLLFLSGFTGFVKTPPCFSILHPKQGEPVRDIYLLCQKKGEPQSDSPKKGLWDKDMSLRSWPSERKLRNLRHPHAIG